MTRGKAETNRDFAQQSRMKTPQNGNATPNTRNRFNTSSAASSKDRGKIAVIGCERS
jgi:hypothetical protein